MIIDITQTTKIGKVYRGGSKPLEVEVVNRQSSSGANYETIHFSCDVHNMGTHIDVMSEHVELEPNRLIGEGIKFDVSHITDRPVVLADLDLSIVKSGVYVFFQTNWDQYLDDELKYSMHPEISFEVIEYLVSPQVNMIGSDTLGLGLKRNHGIIDEYLARHEIYAIENLMNLKRIPNQGFKVYCLPIKVEGIDALPARLLIEI